MNNLRKTLLIICSIFAFAHGVWAQTPVTVPSVSLAEYQSASDWSAFTNMQYMETLTVYDGTTTKNTVPAYIFYFDDFTRSQFVIPANDLVEMVGSSITSMTFYTTSSDVPYTTVSPADVYLMEVSYTSISAYEPKLSATIVYSGFFNIVSTDNGGEMTINFSTPFTYQGGNLLVGIENTVDVDEGYKNINFYGQTVTGASISGYDSSSLDNVQPNQRDFIPKTTFGFTPACEPKSLPYAYGFEDPDEFGCWTMLDCESSSGIEEMDAYEGVCSFQFHWNTTPPQYLISPKFEGTSGMDVSFFYKNDSEDWPETFQVGYSTTTKSPNAFVWGEEVTANDQYNWQLYEEIFPIGTKYVAIKLTSFDKLYLYLDDFNFEPYLCSDEQQCELTFTLTDSDGDGWNGNAIQVFDAATNILLASMSAPNHDLTYTSTTDTYTLGVCDGRELRFEWVNGDFSNECIYTVTDINGNEVFSGEGAMSEPVYFTPDCRPIFIFDGDWNNSSNWGIGVVPQEGSDVIIQADAVIPAGYTAYAWDVALDGGSITVEDGGQLVHGNAGLTATVKKNIVGHGDDNNSGWSFIASPLAGTTQATNVTNLISTPLANYDLYFYDEDDHCWRNYKESDHSQSPNFNLVNGQGYLYAHHDNVELQFTGAMQAGDNGTFTVEDLSYACDNDNLKGFNLVGNPFACNATITDGNGDPMSFYVINGLSVVANTGSTVIPPCTGVVVKATASGQSVTFTKTTAQQSAQPNQLQLTLAQQETTRGGASATIDNAIVSFNECNQLEKFYFMEQNAHIYLSQGQKECAIAYSDKQSEMPLNFKANVNGQYTISVNPEGVEMAYLHLIDNLTGADVDLFATTDYTFTAKTTDYESRFKLVFRAEEDNQNNHDNFAFISNGELIINGTGTLQVIDLLGHTLITDEVNSTFHIPYSAFSTGVYVLRLIDGENVRTQKIVID